jgi:hypothetical protein
VDDELAGLHLVADGDHQARDDIGKIGGSGRQDD